MIAGVFWLVLVVVCVGFLVWLVDKLPIDPDYKTIAKGILLFALIVAVIIFIAGLLGVGPRIPLWEH